MRVLIWVCFFFMLVGVASAETFRLKDKTEKAVPTTTDIVGIEDAADNYNVKKVQLGNFPLSTATQDALDLKVDEEDAVMLSGDQSIAGVKTFSSSPVVPTPTLEYQAATKKYVDDEVLGAGGYNDEAAQDAVGSIISGINGITVTYTDATPTIVVDVGTLNQSTTGNAATATKLATPRTIGGVSFDGSANINLPGVNTSGTQDTSGNAATATALATARTIGGVSFDGTANINLPGVNASGTQDTSGNAATATKLATSRTISGQSFDGTANITVPASGIPITDSGSIITGTNVETALQENRTAINLNTAKETNVPTALSVGTVTTTNVGITSDGGADDVVLPAATNAAAGVVTSTQITALENVTAKTSDGADGEWGISVNSNTSTFAPASGYDSGYTVINNVPNAYYSSANHPLLVSGGNAGTPSAIVLTNASGIPAKYLLPVTLLSPADTDDPLIDKVKVATTLTGLDCVALGGGTISVDIQECDANGANCVTTGATIASCGATNTNDTSLTDTSIAADAYMKMVVGAPSGTVNQVSIKLYGTQTW